MRFRFGLGYALFAVLAALFLLVKLNAAGYSASDENTYYKMGELVARGMTPYSDFFFAHPPLQVYLYAAVFKLYGFSLAILKGISALAAMVAAYFVFRIAYERGVTSAFAATAVFLFSHSVLLFTSFPTGTEFVMMFSAAGFYYFLRDKSMLGGILFAIGGLFGFLALIPAAVVGALLLVRRFGEFKRFASSFAVVFFGVTAAFTLVTRGDYIAQTVVFNLLKPEGVLDTGAVFSRVILKNWLLVGTAALAFFAEQRWRVSVFVPALIAGAYALVFSSMKVVFDYYSLAAAPFLAMLSGPGVSGFVSRFGVRKTAALLGVAALVSVSALVSTETFTISSAYNFEVAQEVADYVRANSAENETIFGEDATTPLISLLSGREIALNFVDSNDLRFRTGVEEPAEVIERLEDSSLRFFLVRKLHIAGPVSVNYGLATLPEFARFIDEECVLAKKFETPWKGRTKEYYVYDCS